MKDLLHPLCLAIASAGFLFLLRDLGKGRRDASVVALSLVFLSSALSFVFSITPVWVRVDHFFGVTNIAAPIAQSCVIAVLVFQMNLLAHWGKPPAKARRRIRCHAIAGTAVIAGLFTLFAMLSPAVQQPTSFALYYAHDPFYKAYLTLYISAYAAGEILLARACWTYARRAQDVWLVRSLRMVAVGASITLVYSAIRLSALVGEVVGFSVHSLDPIAWACGDIGAALTLIGFFLPTLAARVRNVRGWVSGHLAYRRLGPLWEAMHRAVPSIVLMEPPSQLAELARLRSVDFLLYRRGVEIRDGQIELRPYLDPDVREAAEQQRRAQGLTEPDLTAAVTADQIHHALIRKEHRQPVDTPAEYADERLPVPPKQESQHLLRIASFFTPPMPSQPVHQQKANAPQ
ncbi:MAB_1171c family putative transporter [Streptomyces sp. HK10]|uniref:MAB_1171c family putative transporter n=1 Tax=Streptomyces sp. HK10 TaxID=3373255 RepID=UPI003747A894